jgi:hydrogenase/urease accessory protein HupE
VTTHTVVVTQSDAWFRPVRRNLRTAFALEFFVEFGFIVAILATAGLFNGGQPTTTPPVAEAYFVIGFVVTLAVIARTRRLLDAVETVNPAALYRLKITRWAWIALVFSAILPGISLLAAASALPPRE